MGGKGPEVLVTLTTDFGKILSGLHGTKISGSNHLAVGIQVAGVCYYPPISHPSSYTLPAPPPLETEEEEGEDNGHANENGR